MGKRSNIDTVGFAHEFAYVLDGGGCKLGHMIENLFGIVKSNFNFLVVEKPFHHSGLRSF